MKKSIVIILTLLMIMVSMGSYAQGVKSGSTKVSSKLTLKKSVRGQIRCKEETKKVNVKKEITKETTGATSVANIKTETIGKVPESKSTVKEVKSLKY